MDDLTLTSTDDLLDELMKRHDAGVVVMCQDRGGEEAALKTEFWGNPLLVMGILHTTINRLQNYDIEALDEDEYDGEL